MKKILKAPAAILAVLTKIPCGIYKVLALTAPLAGAALVCASIPINSVALGTIGFTVGLGVFSAAYFLMFKTWPKSESMGQIYERDIVNGVEQWYKRLDDGDWMPVTKPATWQPKMATISV